MLYDASHTTSAQAVQCGLGQVGHLRGPRPESAVAQPLGTLAEKYPALSMGSYPFVQNGAYGTNIVIRGQDGALVEAAMMELAKLFPADEQG